MYQPPAGAILLSGCPEVLVQWLSTALQQQSKTSVEEVSTIINNC